MKSAADRRTIPLFAQCCAHCGSTEHVSERCHVRPETRETRQIPLFTTGPRKVQS